MPPQESIPHPGGRPLESCVSRRNKFTYLVIPRTWLVTRNGFGLAGAPLRTVGSQRRWRFGNPPLRKDGRCSRQSRSALPPHYMRVCYIWGIRKRCLWKFGKYRWKLESIAATTNCKDTDPGCWVTLWQGKVLIRHGLEAAGRLYAAHTLECEEAGRYGRFVSSISARK